MMSWRRVRQSLCSTHKIRGDSFPVTFLESARGDQLDTAAEDLFMAQVMCGQCGCGGRTVAVASAMDQALESAVVAGTVPGVVALAADANGVVYDGAYGTREAGTDRAMTLDTVFWIASMTKAITSV